MNVPLRASLFAIAAAAIIATATAQNFPGAGGQSSGSGVQKGNGSGGFAAAVAGTDYNIAITTLTNSLGGNVSLNNAANFFDGPSVAQGTSGTWCAFGTVTMTDTAGAATLIAKLWDGTTVIASSSGSIGAASQEITMGLSGCLTTPAANIRISAKDGSSTSGLIQSNTSGIGKDSTITVFRIN